LPVAPAKPDQRINMWGNFLLVVSSRSHGDLDSVRALGEGRFR